MIAVNSSPIFLRGCVRRDRGRSIRRESDSAVGKFAGLCRCLRELPRRIRKPLGHDARSSSLGPIPRIWSCPMPRQSPRARSCSPSPITIAPTSYPTRSTTRSIFNGSRAATWLSTSATSAISAAMKSFPCLSIRLRLPRHQPHPAGYSV